MSHNYSSSLVSIILPAYNSGWCVKESIESVLNQSWSKWELIIINDGSNDDTEQIINAYNNPKIKYYYQEKKGVSAARNVGLNNACGDFICFLDADDKLPIRSIESRLEVFNKSPDIEFVDGHVGVYNHDFSMKTISWQPKFKGNPLRDLIELTGYSFFGPSWMVKKTDKGVGFDEDLTHNEDLFFYIKLARGGGIYDYTPEEVLHYRSGVSSAMSDLKGLEDGYKKVYKKLKSYDDISTEWVNYYYNKAKSIMLKSYLKQGALLDVSRLLLSTW